MHWTGYRLRMRMGRRRMAGRRAKPVRCDGADTHRTEEPNVLTLCIRYTLDIRKLGDFEAYAAKLPEQIARAGGKLVGYYLPTKFAGPTNQALALIEFADLAAYEVYRARLGADADAVENVRRAEASGCILIEERSVLRRHPPG